MLSYLRIHLFTIAAIAIMASACSSSSPRMSILGMKAPRVQSLTGLAMNVFVEVRNPSRSTLNLSHLRYRLVAEPNVDSRGELSVNRTIPAGASVVVELKVPIAKYSAELEGAPYRLEARLFTVTDKTQRSWELRASGKLTNTKRAAIQVAGF